jgi:hypothetical protein
MEVRVLPAVAAAAHRPPSALPPSAWRSVWTYSTSLVGKAQSRRLDRSGTATTVWVYVADRQMRGLLRTGPDRQYVYSSFVLSLLAELIR